MGMNMMRQTHYNPNAFSHPLTGFFIGLTNVLLYTMIETMNMLSGLSCSSLDTMITKFMAYSILLEIPSIYVGQKKAFNVKYDVADFFLTIKEENLDFMEDQDDGADKSYIREQKIKARNSVNNWLCNGLFRILDWFNEVIYYYTFQFIVFTIPFYRMLVIRPDQNSSQE